MSVASVGFSAPQVQLPIGHDTQTRVKPQPQQIRSTAADMERITSALNRKLQFVVDHNSNEVTIKVIDKNTDKVIKELPPEELQRLHRNLKEAIGLLFDEMV